MPYVRATDRYQLNSMFAITSRFMIYDLFQVSNELANVYKLDALGGVYGDVPQVPRPQVPRPAVSPSLTKEAWRS